MIRRYWIVFCDYCGREMKFEGDTKPTDKELEECGIVVHGPQTHYCNKRCAADANHDAAIKRVGNLKQFQSGKPTTRK